MSVADAKIDDGGVGRMRDRGAGFRDAAAADEDFAGSDQGGVLNVEQMSGMEDGDAPRG